ncbi:hypothetical protein LTR36_000569 [Oleoguttula mirabilis]|uniref:Uncharacterized protein n=1 Tax=Oleoguttula mirabilis TaxID=1507867 RepID=A0AAV9JQE1_9PEZI|nr:hypothetical protein LTR36_000569 [Oleoguttula mirabilis]
MLEAVVAKVEMVLELDEPNVDEGTVLEVVEMDGADVETELELGKADTENELELEAANTENELEPDEADAEKELELEGADVKNELELDRANVESEPELDEVDGEEPVAVVEGRDVSEYPVVSPETVEMLVETGTDNVLWALADPDPKTTVLDGTRPLMDDVPDVLAAWVVLGVSTMVTETVVSATDSEPDDSVMVWYTVVGKTDVVAPPSTSTTE